MRRRTRRLVHRASRGTLTRAAAASPAATPPGGAWRRAFRGGARCARCALRSLSRRRAVRFDSISTCRNEMDSTTTLGRRFGPVPVPFGRACRRRVRNPPRARRRPGQHVVREERSALSDVHAPGHVANTWVHFKGVCLHTSTVHACAAAELGTPTWYTCGDPLPHLSRPPI